jgi:dTDP-4-amino-4,6-dideoxygalactose transaminase
MKIPLVDLKANYLSIKNEIDETIFRVINNSSFIMGDEVEEFDKNFAKFLDVRYSIGVNSGTSALHLALIALDIKQGDEVITVPNTFIATSEAISHTGAKPVFVDIEEDIYNMNPRLVNEKVTKKTRAIIPVHLYGNPCNMKEILFKALEYDSSIKIVEDCAQAHGAEYCGIKLGNHGAIAAFSMFPAKVLGSFGDAGAVVTNDETLANKVRLLRNHGRITKHEHLIEGYNYRISSLQAAILNAKLKYLDGWIEKRRQVACCYNKLFSENNLEELVKTPIENKDGKHCYYMYVVRVKNRENLQNYLKEQGIETGIHYKLPLHLQPAYSYLGYKKGDFPITEKVSNEILSLPLYPEMTEEQIVYVVDSIKKFYKN